MKKLISALLVVLTVMAVNPRSARAHDDGWATVGKVLTGIAAAELLFGCAQPVYSEVCCSAPPVVYAPPPVVYPAPAVVYAPPPPVVYAPPPVVYPAPAVVYAPPPPVVYAPPPVVYYKAPVCVPAPVIRFCPPPVLLPPVPLFVGGRRFDHHGGYDHRGHDRWR